MATTSLIGPRACRRDPAKMPVVDKLMAQFDCDGGVMFVLVGVVVSGVRSPLDRAHSMHRNPVRSHFRHDEGQCAWMPGLQSYLTPMLSQVKVEHSYPGECLTRHPENGAEPAPAANKKKAPAPPTPSATKANDGIADSVGRHVHATLSCSYAVFH